MIRSSVQRMLAEVPDDAVVLDLGGWASPLPRADWVIDVMPYETRGLYGRVHPGVERFTAATWIQRDLCARDPFPFDDGEIDFVVCSHTLEDLRDPVWVCSEMERVGRAGYIEVPSRLEEQSYGVHGPWVGWSHHHWMADVGPGSIEFVFKHHVVHGRASDHFPSGFHERLSEAERVQQLWWEGTFEFGERVFLDPGELDRYLQDFVSAHLHRAPATPWWQMRERARRALRRWVG